MERIEIIYKGRKEGKYGALILDFDKVQDAKRIADHGEEYGGNNDDDDVIITPSSPPLILVETVAPASRNKRGNDDTITYAAKMSRWKFPYIEIEMKFHNKMKLFRPQQQANLFFLSSSCVFSFDIAFIYTPRNVTTHAHTHYECEYTWWLQPKDIASAFFVSQFIP